MIMSKIKPAKKKAAYKKSLVGLLLLFSFVFTFIHSSCKSQSTSPDVNELTRPVIWLDLFKLSFTAYKNGPNPHAQTIQIKNSGQETLDYTLSSDSEWINISPASGSSSGQITEHTVTIDKSGLKAQKEAYTASITVVSSQAYNNPQNIEVSLNLSAEPPPEIWVSKQQLAFSAQEGGSDPSPQAIKINNSGEGTLDYQITKNVSWLNVNPSSGTTKTAERTHTVSVDIAGLKKGTYNGTLTIKDPKAANSPQHVQVSLQISEKPVPKPTPTNNEVGITISPASGGTGTIVTATISISGNTSQISSAFGLELHYNSAIFQYQSTSKGSLTTSWAAVDGGASSGTLTVGGFRGSGGVIPVGSQGSIAVVKFRVVYSSSSDQTTQITMNNIIDDISGMTIKPASAAFTYNH
jgi:hypothetical protein